MSEERGDSGSERGELGEGKICKDHLAPQYLQTEPGVNADKSNCGEERTGEKADGIGDGQPTYDPLESTRRRASMS